MPSSLCMLQGSGALKMLNGPAMSVAREVELKLEASSNCLEQLCSHPHFRAMLKEPAVEQTLNSVYFDTDDFYLLNHGINLRVRQIGDQRLQTLKIVGPSATRSNRCLRRMSSAGRTESTKATPRSNSRSTVAKSSPTVRPCRSSKSNSS